MKSMCHQSRCLCKSKRMMLSTQFGKLLTPTLFITNDLFAKRQNLFSAAVTYQFVVSQLDKLTVTELQLLSARVSFSTTVSDLGVLIDSQLSMSVSSPCCQAYFFELCQLCQVGSSLTEEATKTLAHAFVSSRLDYCNSSLYGVNDGLLKKLHIVHNAAAHVVTAVRKFDHISPVLHELCWLPVRHRITIKLATIVYKCLHGLVPPYLADDCMPVTAVVGRRHLRSADSRCLVVPKTRTVLSRCNFAVTGLLCGANFRTVSISLRIFAVRLKRYLFELL